MIRWTRTMTMAWAAALACLCLSVGCAGSASTGTGSTADAAEIKPVKTLKLPGQDWVSSICVSPDAQRVFGSLGGIDDHYQLWAMDGVKPIFSKGTTENSVAAMSPSGKTAAYMSDEMGAGLVLIDATTGKEQLRIKGDRRGVMRYVPGLRFSSKGDILAVNSKERLLGFDAVTGQEKFVYDNEADLFRLSGFFDDDKKIATSGGSGAVKIWDLTNGKVVKSLDAGPESSHELEVSADGKLLATGVRDLPIKIWDVSTGKVTREIKPWDSNFGTFIFIPKSQLFAYAGQRENAVHLMDLTTGEVKHTLKAHKSSVIAMAVTPDGKRLVTAGRSDRLINIWDLSELR